MNPSSILSRVVERDRCCGCGVCAGCCPSKALSMGYLPSGDLVAKSTGNQCAPGCNLCTSVCSFTEDVLDPRQTNKATFCNLPHENEDVGFYDCAFAGFSPKHRATSASGGMLTWALENLLTSGKIDRVASVTNEPGADAHYCFTFKVSQTPEEINSCAGSIYHQVEISRIIELILREPERRWAITGVPCLCASLRKAMLLIPKLQRSIIYLFGLACGMYQNKFYTELLLSAAGVPPAKAENVVYRGKATSGSARNYQFSATTSSGTRGKSIEYRGLPYFLGKNGFFRVNACNYCRDVFAETADACFMDAWLPEFLPDLAGSNLVVTRKPDLRELFAKSEVVCLPIDIERVVQSQAGQVRRKRQQIQMRQSSSGSNSRESFTISEKLGWFLERYTQRRSKYVWETVRASSDAQLKFWIGMAHVTLMIKLHFTIMKGLKGAARAFGGNR